MNNLKQGNNFSCSMLPNSQSSHQWVFDMGENLAGVASLSFPRSALVPNVPIVLRYAEMFRNNGLVQWQCSSLQV